MMDDKIQTSDLTPEQLDDLWRLENLRTVQRMEEADRKREAAKPKKKKPAAT